MSVSPFSESSTPGTADRGARSGAEARGGELERIPVLDVGTGVGYLRWARPEQAFVFWRLTGRGSPGEDESGSKGGSRVGAGRLDPARDCRIAGSVGSAEACLPRRGDDDIESMVRLWLWLWCVVIAGVGQLPVDSCQWRREMSSSSRVEADVRSTRKVSIVVLPSHQNGVPRFHTYTRWQQGFSKWCSWSRNKPGSNKESRGPRWRPRLEKKVVRAGCVVRVCSGRGRRRWWRRYLRRGRLLVVTGDRRDGGTLPRVGVFGVWRWRWAL